ncbi:molybdenum cofactor guanylyltransferase [Thermodesulforhabdus norvegica]|uniref:Probable molybdenum cofactor guanylyltransferase n=1 Tax=Thermodesulforhabdus norvegica TaxID=39841 RepID=A0A1I4SBA1_9BACT|nr:molybdenum cofactor guanylyltransferase [Thermodesulforhabdus norvegica]SFM61806.1 molybdopterin-guanine dinucleotide biosynthesis protein A [Thermodesulforhabdus norvegica]
MEKKVTGVILAGGKSSRFGQNKALVEIGGERLIDRSLRMLSKSFSPLLIVASDLLNYAGLPAILTKDVVPVPGPLTGIYTALLFSPNEWIFVRAVDMPFLNGSLVELFFGTLSDSIDAVIPVTGRGYEPLCAFYRRTCLKHIAKVLESGGGRIIEFFPKIRVREIREEDWKNVDPGGMSFYNINTREDLLELRRSGLL